uniref:Thioredoxin domain-containing protein n=1 Tax=Globisporangium ultimum (strain ATCC 200006 / CBS 805.95 / DAOM BR144) TaxID=431595 RepID=K3WAK9_GLOUD
MSGDSFLKGVELINAKGDTIQGDVAVRDKVVALFFSAEWCPYCRDFLPALKKFYEEANAETPQLEIVLVSSDNSSEEHFAYLKDKQGPWWSIPFEGTLRTELKLKYETAARKELQEIGLVERKGGLPSLLIVTQAGDVVDRNGVEAVEKDGIKALEKWL